MDFRSIYKQAEEEFEKGDILIALSFFPDLLKMSYSREEVALTDIRTLKARINRLQTDFNKGILQEELYHIEWNKIIATAGNLLDRIGGAIPLPGRQSIALQEDDGEEKLFYSFEELRRFIFSNEPVKCVLRLSFIEVKSQMVAEPDFAYGTKYNELRPLVLEMSGSLDSIISKVKKK